MRTTPEYVTITCPVCGGTEQAEGQGSMDATLNKKELVVRLSYSASVVHDCPEITNPLVP